MTITNKAALVTGGGTGIGRASALALAAAGFGVTLVGRRSEPLHAVADKIQALGGQALPLALDMAAEGSAAKAVAAARQRFGRLDAAFNNAGIEGAFGPIETLSLADFDATMAVNLRGTWLACQAQMPALRENGGGAVVVTSSWLALGAFPGSSIYSASKAALDGMVRALALEGAPGGVRVNAVSPGIIDTPMFRRFADDAAARPFVDHTPAARLGTPEDVGEVVAWLCSDAARFVTGQSLVVDGGYTIPGHRPWLSGAVAPTLT
jgi:NAD(P)-dependent dehydrogenase (short-subunit alcohol dehydrogenase family)